MKQIFVGFADSDKFLAAVDKNLPVNLSISRKHGKPDRRFGMAIDSTVLNMSQAQPNEVIYFQHVVHKYQVLHGEIFGRDTGKVGRLAEQVRVLTEQYLTERGISWRDAMVSAPVNYVMLDGEPTFLKWDKESDSFQYLLEEKQS